MVVVKKTYRRLKEDKLITFANNFRTNLGLSVATFPTPPVSDADMKAAITAYDNAAETFRAERSSYNAGQTRTKRAALIEVLDTQIDYVELTAPDVPSVEALGLEPSSEGKPKKAPKPGKPEGVGAKESDEPLSVTMFCKPVRLENSSAKVSYFVYETNVDGTEERRLMYSGSNSRNLSFGGLETGKVYYFYIRAKTTAGFGPRSAPVKWVGR